MTRAEVSPRGLSVDGAESGWGAAATSADPLRAAARGLLGGRNTRLDRLDRSTVAALVAAHLALGDGETTDTHRVVRVVVAVEDGSAAADRAFWKTARDHGGSLASPALFAATLPSAVGGELAMTFGLRCPSIVLAGAGAGEAAICGAVRSAGAAGSVHDDSGAADAPRGTLHDLLLEIRLHGWNGAGDGVAVATARSLPASPGPGPEGRRPHV